MTTINTNTTSTTAYVLTPDTTGTLVVKTGSGAGTTAMTLDASQNATFAGAVSTSTIKSTTSSPPTIQNSSGTEIGTLCRAWVNFDGTLSTPITPRASYNVSSVTVNGTGDYTINFTNALSDANYSSVITAAGSLASTLSTTISSPYSTTSASALRFATRSLGGAGSSALANCTYVSCAIFR